MQQQQTPQKDDHWSEVSGTLEMLRTQTPREVHSERAPRDFNTEFDKLFGGEFK